jgi:uncharacterized lipoprotein YmbA
MARALSVVACATLAVLLTGCFGPATGHPARLFVLNPTAAATAAADRTSDLRLGIGRITLPEILNRPQIVTQLGDNEVRVADDSQWAEPLEQSVPRVLAENLARLIGTERVSVYPWPSPMEVDLRVEIAISQFEGDATGEVSLAARWRLVRSDGSEAQPLALSTHSQTASDGSIDAMVGAMDRLLEALSRDIAAAIAGASR